MAMGAVSVTGSATLIVSANTARHSILIGNNSSQTLFIGDSSVTTSNGIPIPSGSSFLEDSGGTTLWGGAVYGIVASSTADVHYWERTRGV
jgi:hypothetical protein